ncbi:MAG: ABC transporter substrate-binding protein [Syntrophorhabdus sp.]|nr:ABC transporter substrate-binding protein [Syntrophorhabdus sp.]OPY03832.1 MAG: putative phospholipid-binding protein MlaC precursor [Syntrophorhabdus sp. PtaB.Bin184]
MRKALAGLMIFIVSMVPFHVLAGSALDMVKTNANSVLDVLRDPKLKGDAGKKVKEQKIEAAAEKLFDYVELSKRTLGLNWNKLSMDQRKEFVELFKTLLRNTYIDRITAYTNEKVEFAKEVQLTETTTEVQSLVTKGNTKVPINYRVIKKGGDWMVYDVVIEGVSLISNYRTQFREILGNNPPQVLIDTLRKRVGK